jgi:sorbitol-specific phosphotransferase system component IIA
MKRILLFLIGMFAAVNMQAEVVNDYVYQGMTFSYDTDTKSATLTDGKSIVSSKVVIPGYFSEGGTTYTVTCIGAGAFKGNTNNINHVIIPEEVTTIGQDAFNGCEQIKLIELPSNLSNIGSYAFKNCKRLVHVSCKITSTSTLNPNIFPDNSLMTLYVPEDLLESYKNDDNWKAKFGDRIYGGNMIVASAGGMSYVCADGNGKEASLYAASDASDITVPSNFTFDGNTYNVKTIGRSAFYGFTNLKSLVIEEGIETICDMALQGCSNLKKLVLPSSLKTLGSNVFKDCSSLIHIWCKVIDATILDATKIPKNEMMTLYVPNVSNYTSNGNWDTQFNGRIYEGEMTEVTDANGMTYICATGSKIATLFVGKNESDVVVPSTVSGYTVTGIDRRAFYGFSSLVNLTVSENVSIIGPEAFRDCSSLKTAKLPASLTSIKSKAFNGCSNLARVVSKVQTPFSISDDVFSSAKYLFVPSTKSSDYQFIGGWKNFAYIMEGDMIDVYYENTHFICATESKEAIIIQGDKEASDVNVPLYVQYNGDYYDVKVIDNSAYSGAKVITLTIDGPQELSIEDKAFENCSKLRTLFLPQYLQKLGKQAFTGCNNLMHIVCTSRSPFNINDVFSTTTATLYVPVNLKSAYTSCTGWGSFTNIIECDDMEEVSQDGMTYVCLRKGNSRTATLTKGVSTISDVTIPNTVKGVKLSYYNGATVADYNVTAVAESAFNGIKSLLNLTLSEGITSIGANAFYNCTGLKKVVLPSTLVAIGNEAFIGCSGLADIVCKMESPTGFTGSVFSNTSATLYVPAGKAEIYKATSGWSNFANVVEGDRVEVTHENITYVYASGGTTATLIKGNTTDADLIIPSVVPGTNMKVTAIDKSAFNSNSSLVNLTIPEGVVTIGAYAFQKCSKLQTVILPSTLKSLGDKAFDQCGSIATIVSGIANNNLFVINTDVFSSTIFPIATLYVPIGSGSAYKGKDGWSNFTNIIEGEKLQKTIDDMTYIYLTGPKTAALMSTTTSKADVVIPGTITIGKTKYTVTSIDGSAFKNNKTIVNLTISENIKTIGAYAFQGCTTLKRVELPSTLVNIGEKAFDGDWKLVHVCSKIKVPFDIDESVFSNYKAALYLPDGTLSSYQTKGGWNKFTTIYQGYLVDELISDGMTFICLKNGEGETATTNAILTNASVSSSYVSIPSSLQIGNVSYKVTTIGNSAFNNNSKLVNLTLSENISTIEDNAFANCLSISVVTSMIKEPSGFNDNVFSAYTATLYVPESTRSKYQAAKGWKNFATILEGERNETTTEDGMTYIYATGDKTATLVKVASVDKNITVHGTFKVGAVTYKVTAIDKSVFKDKKTIVSLKIEENVKSIGANAFQNCANLEKIELPSTLTEIGEYAFDNCTRLSHIISRVKSPFPINGNVFAESIYPTAKLYVPTVTSADYKTTAGWENFKNILVGDMKEVIQDDITYYCVQGPNIATLVKASTSATEVTIPATVKDGDITYQVTDIGAYAFSGIGSLKKLTISKGVKSIGTGAFQNCSNLEKVVLPESLSSIDDYAFDKCNRLTLVMSNSETPVEISDNVFSAYTAKLNVPVGSADLYRNADGWKQFSTILEGDMLEAEVNGMTYTYVTGPRTATLTKGVTEETDLTIQATITIGGVEYTVTEIGESAFANTSSIVNLTISGGIESIGANAFRNCAYLTKVELPSSLTSISSSAFNKCDRLSHVVSFIMEPFQISDDVFTTMAYNNGTLYVPVKTGKLYKGASGWSNFLSVLEGEMYEATLDGMTYAYIPNLKIAKLTKGISDAKDVTIPSSISIDGISYQVTDIERSAFYGINSLVNLTVSEGIKTIGYTAFKNCYNLKTVSLPSSLVSIGDYAFENCKKITKISTQGEKPIAINDNVFSSSSIDLYVPAGAASLYQADSNWGQFNIKVSATITISAAKQLAYYSDKALDFTDYPDLKAYVATGYAKSGTIWLTRVKKVPANTGFLLMGDPGEYDIPVIEGDCSAYYKNLFKGTLEGTTLQTTEDGYTNYYLSKGDYGVSFYKVGASGVKLGANRAYLSVPSDIPAVGTASGTETIQVSAALQVPYYSANSLDFTDMESKGLKAYTATGYDYERGTIWLSRVKQVPAETGILIMAEEAGDYDVPKASVASVYENMFMGTLGGKTIQTEETIAGEDYINYYLSKGDYGISFYKVGASGVTLGENRCYLAVPVRKSSASGTRGFSSEADQITIQEADEVIGIPLYRGIDGDEDGTTSVKEVKSGEVKGEEWYTLQGQRVAKPGKGLYIKNGKKVVIK